MLNISPVLLDSFSCVDLSINSTKAFVLSGSTSITFAFAVFLAELLLMFTKLSKDSTIFSPYYKLNFLTWQFLIYPNGYGDLKGKYLSIFLGLKEGDKNAIYPYSYSIELINVKRGKNFVTNSYDYDFQEGGNFTGLSNFYLLQSLEKDGFISKNNEIEFNLYLWPKNIEKEIDYYYNQCYASYNEKEIEEINKYFSA